MKAIAEQVGIALTFFVAAVLAISFFGYVGAVPPGVESGNWTNGSILSYPTNKSNISVSWNEFNYTLNDTQIQACFLEVGTGTALIYQNTTCTVDSGNSRCACNVTGLNDTDAGVWYNATLFAFNSSHNMLTSNVTEFRVDTLTPSISVTGITRKNDTFNLFYGSNRWSDPAVTSETRITHFQDYLNLSWSYTDNTSSSINNCEIDILHEVVAADGSRTMQSYANYSTNMTNHTAVTSLTRNFESIIPASFITDGIYQGKFWLQPHCTDAVNKRGYAGNIESLGWGAVNPIPANTWTSIGLIYGDIEMDDWLNLSSYRGNISYVSLYQYDNASFLTHQYETDTNEDMILNVTNGSAIFAFSTNGWTMLRLNNTNLESLSAANDQIIYYNDTSGLARGNWRSFVNLRANTTKYILNTSATCGTMLDWLAWFNSSDTRCAGGCWEIYNNGWSINENVTIPFGTAVWYLTNGSNVTMTTIPYDFSANAVGACKVS